MMDTCSEDLRSLPSHHLEYALNSLAYQYEVVAQDALEHQLALADEIEDLHWLMKQPAWMQAHIANTGHYDNFLRDIRLAWGVAEKAAVFRPEMIGRQIRYALLQTTVNSLASNIFPQVLIAGLRLGHWNAKTTFVYAKQITHSVPRVDAFTQVGAFLLEQHDVELAFEVFNSALAALREIEYPSNYVEALLALAPHLPPNLLSHALAATQEIADAKERARVMGALAPRLPSDLFYEALEMVRGFEDSDTRSMALAGLAPYLPQSWLEEALEIVQEGYGAKAK